MRLIIIEDEAPARARLRKLILELRPQAEIVATPDSVEDSVAWFSEGNTADLAFMDIQLADGLSFEIFRKVEVKTPVIFTTAYDEFALKAFKVNSLDYLLKPIDATELRNAFRKFDDLRQPALPETVVQDLLLRLKSGVVEERRFRERFLVKVGDQLRYVPVAEIAYLVSDSGYTTIVTQGGHRLLTDHSLEQLVKELDPALFMQVSRQCIVCIHSISKIHTWYNSRLKLDLNPAHQEEILVSRDKVKTFKDWLDR